MPPRLPPPPTWGSPRSPRRCSKWPRAAGTPPRPGTSMPCWRAAPTSSGGADPRWIAIAPCRSMLLAKTTAQAALARGFTIGLTGCGRAAGRAGAGPLRHAGAAPGGRGTGAPDPAGRGHAGGTGGLCQHARADAAGPGQGPPPAGGDHAPFGRGRPAPGRGVRTGRDRPGADRTGHNGPARQCRGRHRLARDCRSGHACGSTAAGEGRATCAKPRPGTEQGCPDG